MVAPSRLCSTLSIKALALVSLMVLSACASVHPTYDIGSGPKVAGDSHYKSGTMKPYSVRGQTYYPAVPQSGFSETGLASWYGYESPNHTTADGEIFDTDAISAAHKTFPLPSIAEVTNLDTGKTIRLRVNDRGPFVSDRIIDLSRGAAKALGVYGPGTAHVRITWLGPADAISTIPVYTATAAPSPSSDDALHYIVQLGAFSQKDNAQNAQDRMDGARMNQRDGLYIVYLGPYTGADAAESHRQAAIDAGFTGAILKRDE